MIDTVPQKKVEHPYDFDPKYTKRAAYFSMEFAIDQPFKIYSGGLGFLSGSHMRSAYDLKQNLVGIGILWKYGYYDQTRKEDRTMDVLFQEKRYSFLEDTGIKFQIQINNHPVWVKVIYLPPETFETIPMYFLSTDLPENDYLAQTITHKLYDSNPSTRISQYILLGLGGAKLLEELNHEPDIYHMNEAHALPLAFHLYKKFGSIEKVKEHLVFTTHTPEKAGNEVHETRLLVQMGFFNGLTKEEISKVTDAEGGLFNHTLTALRLSKIANGVSKKHAEVSKEMWSDNEGICKIIPITNSQNQRYWANKPLYDAVEENDQEALVRRKRRAKAHFLHHVADQSGKIMDPDALTLVWARRFAEYKRPDLIARDLDRFEALISNKDYPVQIIWAGKPYPHDYEAVGVFDSIVHMVKRYKNATILVGYELYLSRLCKEGADVWLNTPRIPREASGTSGMTAAMNGAVNLSTKDGWVLEFANHGVNSFILPEVDTSLPVHEQDLFDGKNLLDVLEKEVVPTYYNEPEKWNEMVMNSLSDVVPYFSSDRMASDYYEKLYEF